MKSWIRLDRWQFVVSGSAIAILAAIGCKAERPVEFEPNMVFAKSIEIQSGSSMQKALAQTQDALKRLFGTAADPQLPELLKSEDYAELISIDRVKAAGHTETRRWTVRKALCYLPRLGW